MLLRKGISHAMCVMQVANAQTALPSALLLHSSVLTGLGGCLRLVCHSGECVLGSNGRRRTGLGLPLIYARRCDKTSAGTSRSPGF